MLRLGAANVTPSTTGMGSDGTKASGATDVRLVRGHRSPFPPAAGYPSGAQASAAIAPGSRTALRGLVAPPSRSSTAKSSSRRQSRRSPRAPSGPTLSARSRSRSTSSRSTDEICPRSDQPSKRCPELFSAGPGERGHKLVSSCSGGRFNVEDWPSFSHCSCDRSVPTGRRVPPFWRCDAISRPLRRRPRREDDRWRQPRLQTGRQHGTRRLGLGSAMLGDPNPTLARMPCARL